MELGRWAEGEQMGQGMEGSRGRGRSEEEGKDSARIKGLSHACLVGHAGPIRGLFFKAM